MLARLKRPLARPLAASARSFQGEHTTERWMEKPRGYLKFTSPLPPALAEKSGNAVVAPPKRRSINPSRAFLQINSALQKLDKSMSPSGARGRRNQKPPNKSMRNRLANKEREYQRKMAVINSVASYVSNDFKPHDTHVTHPRWRNHDTFSRFGKKII